MRRRETQADARAFSDYQALPEEPARATNPTPHVLPESAKPGTNGADLSDAVVRDNKPNQTK